MSNELNSNPNWELQGYHPRTTCAKCGYIRQSHDTAPEWQCPKCELAYIKTNAAAEASRNQLAELRAQREKREKSSAADSVEAHGARTLRIVGVVVLVAMGLAGGVGYMKTKHGEERAMLAQAALRQQQIDGAKQQQQQEEDVLKTISHALNYHDPSSRERLHSYATQGNTTAMVALGRLAQRDTVKLGDQNQARQWYEKAAAEGDPNAMVNLGYLFELGISVDSQPELAANWYQKAARQGHASGLYSLAFLHENGIGVGQNAGKAYMLYELAARAHSANPNASYQLIPNDRSGIGGVSRQLAMKPTMSPVDIVRALELADAWKTGKPF